MSSMTCPHCQQRAYRDLNWIPPAGIDPKLKRFVCSDELCGIEFYTIRATIEKEASIPGIPGRTITQSSFNGI